MSANADITVVITCFNYGGYLGESVESALTQEGGPPRVIVVDDGSTEASTGAALERLPAGVELIRQENQGVCIARNSGLRQAATPLVLVLDADDRLAPGALAALRPPLARNPRLGFAYGPSRFFGEWEGVLRFPPYDPYRLLYRHIVGLSALMRREVFEDTGGFDPAFAHYEDWEFWIHALARGWRGMQVDAVALEYRRHLDSKFSGDRDRYRRAFRQLRAKYPALYKPDSPLVRESELRAMDRLAYRLFWGPRPLPALVEQRLYALRWRARQRR